MHKSDILEKLLNRVKPICDTQEEIDAIPLYVKSDYYRNKIIDFIDIADKRGDVITADQLMTLTIILSNEESSTRS